MHPKTKDYASKQREKTSSNSNKKELLQKRFIKSVTATNERKDEHIEHDEFGKYKKLYKKLKNEFDKICSENEDLKKQVKQGTEQDLKTENEAKNLKKEIFDLKNKLNNSHEEITNLNNEILESNILIHTQKEELSNLAQRLSKAENRLIASNNRNEDLQRILNDINNDKRNHNLKFENRINELENTINTHLRRFEKLHEKLKRYKEKSDMYDDLPPEETLKTLYDKLTLSNVFEYKLTDSLTRKYKIVKRNLFNLKRNNSTGIVASDVEIEYGYLKLTENEDIIFVNLENEERKVKYVVNMREIQGTPCASFLNEDDSVDVFWVYETELEMMSDIEISNKKTSKAKDIVKKTEEIYECIGNFSVLVLTSSNGIRYRNRLEKHGIIATWIDPFEKSEVHVRNLMNTYDIILMCVENMPHNVLGHVDENSPKYQFITNHNEEKIVGRSRFAAMQLGLISTGRD